MSIKPGAIENRIIIQVAKETISPMYDNGKMVSFYTKDNNDKYTITHENEKGFYNYHSYNMSFETCMFLMKHEFYFIQNNYGLDLYGVCKRKAWKNDMYVYRNIHDNKLYLKKDNDSIEYCPTLEDFQSNDWMII